MKMKSHLLWACFVLAVIQSANAQPLITTQPLGQTNVVGSTVTLSVEATGAPPLYYQWRRGSNLAGKTSAALVFTNLQTTDAGNYNVVVTNIDGAVTSRVALVRVLVPPAITVPPTNQSAEVGDTVTYSGLAVGTAPLFYQWVFQDGTLPNGTKTNLYLRTVQLTNAGP